MNYGFALENAHLAPVGRIVSPLAATAGATTANNVVKQATPTTHGNAGMANVPQSTMSAFGNVGLPLTILAALALLLIGLLYMRRQKAKKERAAAAARVASAETVRVALPRDLAGPRSTADDDATQAFRQRPPTAPTTRTQAMPNMNGHQVGRPHPPAAAPRPAQRPAPTRPSTTPAPEWPSSGPEWPT